MARRIEQSRKHGHDDPRWTTPVHVVSAGSLPAGVPEAPGSLPPTLRLVGGTDVTPEPELLDLPPEPRA